MKRIKVLLLLTVLLMVVNLIAQPTKIIIAIPKSSVLIDTMIYGQMLEHINDGLIYDGILNHDGSERTHVTKQLKQLQIPIMRWPGGTIMHEYHWEKGIGPLSERPKVTNHHWGGLELNLFGTDEFIAWCRKVRTTPYINFNMGNDPAFGGTLEEAISWIDYVNGSVNTKYGKKRAVNGHPAPYNVKYWCIGNENYGPWGKHTPEKDTVYSNKLYAWSVAIRKRYPKLSLLAVGYTVEWNRTVLEKNGHLIDFLTQHYYVNTKVKEGKAENPLGSLFAPLKMEQHLSDVGVLLEEMNRGLGRTKNPIRLSVDEWNNRHAVYDGKEYKFTRHSPRLQLDAAVAAGILNVFIRQSPTVGMANYIFPVNAHGLMRTIGDTGVYLTPLYHVFKQYRQWMIGNKLEVSVDGPGILASETNSSVEGDSKNVHLGNKLLTWVDAAAVRTKENKLHVALVNRNPTTEQEITIDVPKGYKAKQIWVLSHPDINASNQPEQRFVIAPRVENIRSNSNKVDLKILPCGLHIIEFVEK